MKRDWDVLARYKQSPSANLLTTHCEPSGNISYPQTLSNLINLGLNFCSKKTTIKKVKLCNDQFDVFPLELIDSFNGATRHCEFDGVDCCSANVPPASMAGENSESLAGLGPATSFAPCLSGRDTTRGHWLACVLLICQEKALLLPNPDQTTCRPKHEINVSCWKRWS